MNHNLLHRIATWLEAGAPHGTAPNNIGFNMGVAYGESWEAWRDGEYDEEGCGSACCIAGAAIQFAGVVMPEQGNQADKRGPIYRKAAALLDLPMDVASDLFFPDEYQIAGNWDRIRPQEAAKVIRHLQATGRTDWSII